MFYDQYIWAAMPHSMWLTMYHVLVQFFGQFAIQTAVLHLCLCSVSIFDVGRTYFALDGEKMGKTAWDNMINCQIGIWYLAFGNI